MKDQLVTFETAKSAKEKGFDEECCYYYVEDYGVFMADGVLKKHISPRRIRYKFQPHLCSAPTQSLLQRWLREIHNIKVCVSFTEVDNWLYEINHEEHGVSGYASYEEALEAGLQEALNLIK